MTMREILVKALDREGGRGLLGLIANVQARRVNGGAGMRVAYDRQARSWRRQALGETLYDGPVFGYYANHLDVSAGRTPWTAAAQRNWFVHHAPGEGDVILDIGAEIGSDVAAFSRAVGATGRVISVEAHPATYRLLEATVRESAFSNVTCRFAAIAGSRGEIFIEDAASMLSSAVSATRSGHRVPALSLDDLCDEYGVGEISLLKMNIEGSERDAFLGMRRTLERTRQVCIACHDFRADRGDGEFFRTRQGVIDALLDAGFEVAPERPGLPDYMRDHVHARRVRPAVAAKDANTRVGDRAVTTAA